MKLTKTLLEKLVKEEMTKLREAAKGGKLLGGAKKPEDVKPTEVDADEFGTNKSLEDPEKRDHNIEESYNAIRALNSEEQRLVKRLRQIREQKVQHAKKLISQ